MWLFLPFGFISVVHKPDDAPGTLSIRARDAVALDNLRRECPDLGPTIEGGGTDYPFRAHVDALAFGCWLGAFASQIDFGNFKAQTTKRHGRTYHDACMTVWSTMHRMSPARRPIMDEWRRNDGGMPRDFFAPLLTDADVPMLPVRRGRRWRA
jgi:hypothetical protein